ncbi:MAG: hypothetical protein ACJ74R_02045 [Gaiellaceae bacterium]
MIVVRPAAIAVSLLAVLLAGCGSSSPPQITIGAARVYKLAGFPARFAANKPTRVSFRIDTPSGEPLSHYRTGSGPHTGVHVIVVRSDLASIIHKHPKPSPSGEFVENLTLPAPGRYRVVVDAYPAAGTPRNFQLFKTVDVPGKAPPKTLPPFRSSVKVDGYTFTLHRPAQLRSVQANFLTLRVTRPDGTAATFTPWFGALAHAIFFRAGTLDYFHTHVCAGGASGCTAVLGGSRVTGAQTQPGNLRVGVLLSVGGTWRLFVQTRVDGRVLTAPFTLKVR